MAQNTLAMSRESENIAIMYERVRKSRRGAAVQSTTRAEEREDEEEGEGGREGIGPPRVSGGEQSECVGDADTGLILDPLPSKFLHH